MNGSLDALVDDDADSVLCDVEDAAGSAVVGFVGHTLLNGSITLQMIHGD